jgi:hypothetical protein
VSFDGDTLQNYTSDGIRIYLVQETVTISNCVIRNNTSMGVVSTIDYGIHTVRNNTIEKNGTGIYFDLYSTGKCEVHIPDGLKVVFEAEESHVEVGGAASEGAAEMLPYS